MEYLLQTISLTYIVSHLHNNPLDIEVILPILQIRKLKLIKSWSTKAHTANKFPKKGSLKKNSLHFIAEERGRKRLSTFLYDIISPEAKAHDTHTTSVTPPAKQTPDQQIEGISLENPGWVT